MAQSSVAARSASASAGDQTSARKKKRVSFAAGSAPPDHPSAASSPAFSALFQRPLPLYFSAALLRVGLLLYGLWQDANSPLKYTDIDYLVFTDAARFVSRGQSPYDRETYRYTPVLAWLLLPTAHVGASPLWDAVWFSSGKVLFAAADLVAGWLLERVLTSSGSGLPGLDPVAARKFAAIWLLNPMVATISTRGSSEGLLGVLVMALLSAVMARRVTLAGLLLGFSVHFKIYPFIYAPAIVWWMDAERMGSGGADKKGSPAPGQNKSKSSLISRVTTFATPARIRLAAVSLSTFVCLNAAMYICYGPPFLTHTFLHHVTRIDHRHNFSPYNTQLYLASAFPDLSALRIESVAFLPQLVLSCFLIPIVLAKKDLPAAMLAQTFAFVTFNKVCTSQYFLWYMVLLPLYLPRSSFLKDGKLGIFALSMWVASQGLWLHQGYGLEFLGLSTFLPGLWLASLGFFLVNCWILGIIIADVLL
ncbi:GPI mannosyltransferase 1 [Lasiosphaeria miniovina]|uniref:GPI mannosyltransferase 1 n=1 Tax=Lasiosphaeria miniovina TaxID=1954250 RepID=A0AA40ADI6_9PEZI|nr:GPI mannosyltransferase 1 [Lasiosphaeria miniovina]KAK0713888.1 GPI mannosyltransferase 1 [Lasiosphaeria miniovina]